MVTWVPVCLPLSASECSADGLIPFGPTRSTAPLTKSEPDRSSACSSSSYALADSMSSPSTKARNSPRARSTPRLRAPPGPPCPGCSSVNRGSAAAWARAIWALPSLDPSSTIITSRSPNDCAAIESRQSPRSPALLKNATTTLILGVVTGVSSLPSSGGRGFPAERHRVVNALHVDLVPQREYDKQPHLPPRDLGIAGPEAAQDVQRRGLVQPLAGLRRADRLLRETIHAAAQPLAHRNPDAPLPPFPGAPPHQPAHLLAPPQL